MRTYEVMYILRPDMADEDVEKLISTVQQQAETAKATVKNTEKMGKRRLAYDVRGFSDGLYILMNLEAASGDAIHEVERRLRVTEQVIKFLSVRVDEERKRLGKIQKLRASRVKRSTAEPAPVESVAAPEAAPEASA